MVEDEPYLTALGRMLRAAGKRVGQADPEQLKLLMELSDSLDAAIVTAIRGLRASGTTWEEIGDLTNVTRQAALMRWRKRL